MAVGIEKLNLYAPRFFADAIEIAKAFGHDNRQVMVEERSVVAPFEDAATLAVNAVKRTLDASEIQDVELLIVGSESGLDWSKATSTWVHRFCGFSQNCRNFDVKLACYGTTGALKLAAAWIASHGRPGKKALVVSTDFTRTDIGNSGYDFIGGGSAVAMLVSNSPKVLEIDLNRAGYWTSEIYDTYRPTSSHEVVHRQKSLYSYLDALDGAYDHYEQIVGSVDYDAYFKKHIYHAPFPGMALQAHQVMLNRFGITDKAAIRNSFQQKVEESLRWAKRVGTAYGASNFVCLLGLLDSTKDLEPGDRISIFAYGSGCQGEFYDGVIGAGALENGQRAAINDHLNEREPLSFDVYKRVEDARHKFIDCPSYMPEMAELRGPYERQYKGRGLLVLRKVDNYEREYEWS
jgi:hydroxymethylglutaryl-CoA synthase